MSPSHSCRNRNSKRKLTRFAPTVKRLLESKDAYIMSHPGGSLATAGDPKKDILIAANTKATADDARAKLKAEGLEVHDGRWTTDAQLSLEETAPPYIAAVAYESSEDKPGIWLDAYAGLPTSIQVLKAMFDEFRQTGELDEVSFEEFIRHANPNVIVVSPAEIQGFVLQKEGC